MDNYNTSADIWKMNSQQHVSLDKHNQMIQGALQWQRMPDDADHAQTSILKALRTRIAHALSFVTRPAANTKQRTAKEAKAT